MINIYYGRESMDKTKFMFSKMGKKAILIVPDQYTLQAERDALKYLDVGGIMDIQIMGFTRFASGILKETGVRMDVISRAGREMLLAGIIKNNRSSMNVFRGISQKMDLVTTFHDFIAEMKQSNAGPNDLKEAISKLKDGTLLKRKLEDVHLIYEKYCESVKDKYMDNEDFMTIAAEKIAEAKSIENTEFWLYGFDSFTGKHYSILKAINDRGLSINPVITWDENGGRLFEITSRMIRKLKEVSGEEGTTLNKIPKDFQREMVPEIAFLEKNYEAYDQDKIKNQGNVKIVRCQNPYNEACTAAGWIWHLVRDEGLRLRDIALICNNIDEQKELYERVFSDYGIQLFVDCKRSGEYHPLMNLIVALMRMITFEFQRDDVIKYIKTGFTELTEDEIRNLEIYTYKYRISGHKWNNRFRIGLMEYEQETIDQFEKMRQQVITPVSEFKRKIQGAETVREKVLALNQFLVEQLNVPQQLENMVSKLEENGQMDIAEETAQLWKKIVEIFQQMVILLADEQVTNGEFLDLLKSGIAAIEIGVIPPGVDGLVMGNIQRSRRESVKAAVIVSANEGILPEAGKKSGVVSDEERNVLAANELDICKASRLQVMEEKLAVYRNLVRPSQSLYISYPMADNSGGQLEPSQVISKLTDNIDELTFEDDIFKEENVNNMLGGYQTTKNSLIMALANFIENENLKEDWKTVYQWFNQHEDMDAIVDQMFESFKNAKGDSQSVLELYGKKADWPLRLSPSRLELFGKCPFSHFVKYGLKPEEINQYQIGPAEAGTVYHNCMMLLSKKLSEVPEGAASDGDASGLGGGASKNAKDPITGESKRPISITHPDSPWMTVTRQEVHQMVDEILKDISKEYNEGILSSGAYEKYKAQRIQKVCEDSAWMAIDHVRRGDIKNMYFEIPFGKSMNKENSHSNIPGLMVETNQGKVSIEGQIDRWDIVKGNYSKVIDYKSGNDTFNMELARAGMKLQIFIYLMAVSNDIYKPGGAFYFHINEGCCDVPEHIGENDKDVISQFKMDGFTLGNEEMLKAIDHDEKPKVYKKSGQRVMSEVEFNDNMNEIKGKIKDMGGQLLGGNMEIKPKEIKQINSCTFCPYRGICKFDVTISGCKYLTK